MGRPGSTRPRSGGRNGVALALAATVVAAGLVAAPAARAHHYDSLLAPSSVCPYQRDITRTLRQQKQAMRCLHRYARRKAGVPARKNVKAQDQLQRAAQAKAADIMRCQQFSHQACGREWLYWPKQVGYYVDPRCASLAENIGWASRANASARSMMSAWLHSDRHRTTILRERWRDIGVGLKRGNFRGNPRSQVWVAFLGRQYESGTGSCP